jgi:hypothetical protein
VPENCSLTDFKFVGEAKGKFKAIVGPETEGPIYVFDAKVAPFR